MPVMCEPVTRSKDEMCRGEGRGFVRTEGSGALREISEA